MNFNDRQEFEALLAEQARLRQSMKRLEERIEHIRKKLETTEEGKPTEERAQAVVTPPPLPPLAAALPPVSEVKPPEPEPPAPVAQPVLAKDEAPPLPPKSEEAATPPPPRDSLEMRLGTVWLARLGIIIFLTGLVFLGNFAWQAIIHRLSAGGKLALITLAGAALAGIGKWLEGRRAEVRNFARILLAGGAATIYYAAYAAHYVAPLRVIESPLLGGLLLLILSGAFVAWAHARQSQTIATLAILLAYYTSAINPIGTFTLFSTLSLTGAAVFFLVRNRWSALSWVSLIGSYGSYAWWRLVNESPPVFGPASAGESWVLASAFLIGYWLIFTAGVFWVREGALPPASRTSFLTLNNFAFFACAAEQVIGNRPDELWLFCMSFGAALLALAVAARRMRPDDLSMDGAYLAQGLASVTAGLALKLSGPNLAITLALESAVLTAGVRSRQRIIFGVAAGLAALGAFLPTLAPAGAAYGPIPEATVAALLIFDAWQLKKWRGTLAAMDFDGSAAFFSLQGLWLFGDLLYRNGADFWFSAACGGAALVCTASIYVLRLPETALPGQLFLPIGIFAWSFATLDGGTSQPWWNPWALAISALTLGHWWQHQITLTLRNQNRLVLQGLFAAALVGLGLFWIHLTVRDDGWLIAPPLVALALFLYGLATRNLPLALVGQCFAVVGFANFLLRLDAGPAHRLAALVPIGAAAATALILSSSIVRKYLPAGSGDGNPATSIARIYRASAMALLWLWGWVDIAAEWQLPFFSGLGALLVVAAAKTRNPERYLFGFVYAGGALIIFWQRAGEPAGWLDLAALLIIPASLRLARRLAPEMPGIPARAHTIFTGAVVASVWLWTTQWALEKLAGRRTVLTMAWALLAPLVFAAGLGLRERVYRLGGFVILALAVGRIFVVDVWQFETIYRIVSFLVLGVVLLALGFVYNRFAEPIRKWL